MLDETLVELETDKIAVEVKAEAAGTLAEIAAVEGTDVEVGALLGRLETGDGGCCRPRTRACRRASERCYSMFPSAVTRRCVVCSTSTASIQRRSRGPARAAAC